MEHNTNNTSPYLKTKVLTASPEQLQLMLYDGAIRFCEQARNAIEKKEMENSYKLLTRAENILMELCNSMREDVAPETCANMRRLYLFCYNRLVTANIEKQLKPVDETLKILRHLRETWIMLMEKLQNEKTSQQSHDPTPNPDDLLAQEIGATISCQG